MTTAHGHHLTCSLRSSSILAPPAAANYHACTRNQREILSECSPWPLLLFPLLLVNAHESPSVATSTQHERTQPLVVVTLHSDLGAVACLVVRDHARPCDFSSQHSPSLVARSLVHPDKSSTTRLTKRRTVLALAHPCASVSSSRPSDEAYLPHFRSPSRHHQASGRTLCARTLLSLQVRFSPPPGSHLSSHHGTTVATGVASTVAPSAQIT